MLNLTSNERRLALGELIPVTVLNPTFGDPLGGLTYEDYKNEDIPANMTIIQNDFGTPVNDRVSIGVARQFGTRYAVQADVVHAEGRDEPMSPSINFFEDPETGLPLDPAVHGRPYPDYVSVTSYQSTGKSRYDGLQVGFSGRPGQSGWTSRLQFTGSYTLSWTWNNHSNNRGGGATNPFNLDDEWSFAGTDQRNRFTLNAITTLPYDVQFSVIYFAGSPRPINISTNLDPFGLGYSGRWLDAAGNTLPRYGERTEAWDHKLDLRLSKRVRVGRMSLEGVVDVFNVLNRFNLTSYGTNYFSRTYLQPSNSTNLFYQPRQVQLGFRISY